MPCSVDTCDKGGKLKRGWCEMHYRRWLKNGSVGPAEPLRNDRRLSPEERFWSFVRKRGPDRCWMWLGHTDKAGYGRLSVNGNMVYVHRFSYELHTGKSLGDRQADHKCRHRWCVNPKCLRPATIKQQQENRRVNRNNKTGFRGVYKDGNRFRSQFEHNGKAYRFGPFDTAKEADEAVRQGRNEFYTHNIDDR
jgi:hypothetical protein